MTTVPRVPVHVLPPDALPRFDPPTDSGGLVVGWDRGEPVTVTMFRNAPTRIGVFAAAYVGNLLAFRALAVGALAMVATPRPLFWAGLAQVAPPNSLRRVPPNAATPPGSSPLSPLLVLDDATGPDERVLRTDLGAWQTQVVLRSSQPPSGRLRPFDLVVVQQVPLSALPLLARTFDLSGQHADWLSRLPDDIIGLVSPGRVQFVNLAPTPVEQQCFGPPTRRDG